jgi:hypothetical protein
MENISLTAISRQADIERPAPSICFKAYSFGSDLFFWGKYKNIIFKQD